MEIHQSPQSFSGTAANWLARQTTNRIASYVFAFHGNDEIGPVMLARIAKQTGLTPDDL